MSCAFFQDRIEGFVAGTLEAGEMAAAQAHLDHCLDCQAVVRILGANEAVPAADTEALAGAILGQTSGSVCRSVQEQLCDLVDGALAEADAWLVRGHLEHCPGCAALADTLESLPAPLAAMAELPLDAQFEREVMRATIHATRMRPAHRWWGRVVSGWAAWSRRPRFPLEFSYAATLVLVLLMGTPVSPFHGVPAAALGWLRASISAPPSAQPEPDGHLTSGWDFGAVIPRPVREAAGTVKGHVVTAIGTRKDQMEPVWARLGTHGGELTSAVGDLDLPGIGTAVSEIACDVKLLWRGLRSRISSPEDLTC